MNIQVATSEIPVPQAIRNTSRIGGGNFPQRSQQRFRGNRGTGPTRGEHSFLFRDNFLFKI